MFFGVSKWKFKFRFNGGFFTREERNVVICTVLFSNSFSFDVCFSVRCFFFQCFFVRCFVSVFSIVFARFFLFFLIKFFFRFFRCSIFYLMFFNIFQCSSRCWIVSLDFSNFDSMCLRSWPQPVFGAVHSRRHFCGRCLGLGVRWFCAGFVEFVYCLGCFGSLGCFRVVGAV